MALAANETPTSVRPGRILLIDDDPLAQRISARLFAEPDYAFAWSATAGDALEQIARIKPDVAIVANALPDRAGLELLRQIHAADRRLPVLYITAAGSSGEIIEAMKLGAFDHLAKPLDPELLAAQVVRAIEARRLMLAPVELTDANEIDSARDELVGRSASMHEVYKAIGRVAAHDVPVLICGEPGTGKGFVARLIHENGPRAASPLLNITCGETTSCNELDQGQGGVLVLEEVGDLPPASQNRLVELLRERTLKHRREANKIDSGVTILATTSTGLAAKVAAGRFQPELFYLLGAYTITLPPLHDRRDDIPLLVEHFVKLFTRIQRTFNGSVPRVSPDALSLLCEYDWPGNLDELQSVLKHALLEGQGTVLTTQSLMRMLGKSADAEAPQVGVTTWQTLVEHESTSQSDRLYTSAIAEMEQKILPLVMARCGGSQVKAAKALGITRGSLRKKLRNHGLLASRESYRGDSSIAVVDPVA